MRLNLGCGQHPMHGWVNVDQERSPGVDVSLSLGFGIRVLTEQFGESAADELHASHLIEHLHDMLSFMQDCWEVARPGAMFTLRCPHGATNDAWENPTHVRECYETSFVAFAQPYWWRDATSYTADWQVRQVTIYTIGDLKDAPQQEVMRRIRHERNIVLELVAELEAIKPARPRVRSLQEAPVYDVTILEGR